MSKFGPKKRYFKEDNWKQTQSIVSMFPQDIQSGRRAGQWDEPLDRPYDRYHRYRKPRTDFSDGEKASIMRRVSLVGAERAAEEAGTSKKVIMSLLNEIDENISQLNSEWEKDTYSKDTGDSEERERQAVISVQASDSDQEATLSLASLLSPLSSSEEDRSHHTEQSMVINTIDSTIDNAISNQNGHKREHQNNQNSNACYNDNNNSRMEAKSMKSKSPVSNVTSPLYQDTRAKKVKISQFIPFDKHPFRMPDKDSTEMQKLISSIEKEGLLNPPIVRRINAPTNMMNISSSSENAEVASGAADVAAENMAENVAESGSTANNHDEIYQIVCGHRRIEACKALGYKDVLVRIVEFADDDEATLAMISSNVQRERIEFPERVRACSLMYEAKKHQGVARSEEGKTTRAYVGKIWNVSGTTVERFLKLAALSDGLLDLIGRKKITSIVGMEIADMSHNMQDLMESVLFENKELKPTLQQAKAIRAQGEMTREEVIALLQREEKPAPKKLAIRFSSDELSKLLPEEENPTEERVKAFIFERLGIAL
ncbi:MAG: ParB N-terminal domain-containing protein [Synergistaceae bacterium]|nr:ParB N-terminal domain-containing protein [Synergistaceae bacterium]